MPGERGLLAVIRRLSSTLLVEEVGDDSGPQCQSMRQARVLIAWQRPGTWSRYAPSRFKVEEVSQMKGLVEAMVNRVPAVLLLAIDFPGLGGPSGIRDVRRLSPATKIVVLSRSVNEKEEIEVLKGGARGYSGPVGTDVLVKMIDKVHEGEVWAGRKIIGALLEECMYAVVDHLSAQEHTIVQNELHRLTFRERQILRLLGEGASNKEIASALKVTVSTIKAHLTKIFRKLGQPDRVRLALYVAAIGGATTEVLQHSHIPAGRSGARLWRRAGATSGRRRTPPD